MRKWGTFGLAAATLSLETSLIRVFALAQGYHFAFMTISIALLGMGAGGTLLAVWSSRWRKERADLVLAIAAAGFAVTTLASYMLLNTFPFDVYRIAWERVQILYLVVDYVALTMPFFCSGLAIGLALEQEERGNVTYAANLIGSAAGCTIALIAMSRLGGAGTVALSAAGGGVAAMLYAYPRRGKWGRCSIVVLLLCGVGVVFLLALAWLRPSWFEVRLSPYRPLSYTLQFPDARVLSSQWNAYSRIDVVESGAIHVSPGLSLGYAGEVPLQRGLFVDAHAQAAIVDTDRSMVGRWADHLPLALIYYLRPRSDALILEPGGGLDVVVAQSQGAKQVTIVSSNPLVADAVREYGTGLYEAPNAQVIVRAPRSFVRSQRGRGGTGFDVIDLALNDAQRAVVSGAYALSEEYDYTVQAFVDYMALLKPDGLLAVHRWIQTPPSESLRAWSLAVTALEQSGGSDPRESLVAVRSWSTMLILAKKGAFTEVELEMVRRFCAARQFDLVYLPDLRSDEVNRYNVYEGAPYFDAFGRLLAGKSRPALYREHMYDVRAPTDDKPYYHHFFRWRQASETWESLGHMWQPFGGGGYLILIALFGIATLTSTALILLPLGFRRQNARIATLLPRGPVLVYFGCLGIAYLAVEIPLIQRFVLFADHPTMAFVTVVSVLLVASGVGSLLAPRFRARTVILLVVVTLVLLLALLPAISDLVLGCALYVRLMVASLLLAPLGLFMGVPFPAGVALLRERAPQLIPWAWGINGCTSVIASIFCALVSLDLGFNAVLGLACAFYLAAWRILTAVENTGLARGGKA